MTIGLGGGKIGFPRLIKEMDCIAGKIDEEVLMQIGDTDYVPLNAEYFKFLTKSEMEERYKNARVVVCHDGVGSIITGLKYGKPIIAMPRMKKYGEVAYDSKADLAEELAKEERIIVIYDVKNLESALKNINNMGTSEIIGKKSMLIYKLMAYLDNLEKAASHEDDTSGKAYNRSRNDRIS